MKTRNYARFLASALIVLAGSLPCVARNSQTITLEDSVALEGVRIAPGVYKIAWESHSPEATVTLLKGKHVVATARARWVERNVKYVRTALVYAMGKDGSRRIVEVRLAGMHQALVFDPAPGSAALDVPACATVAPRNLKHPTVSLGPIDRGECVQYVTGPAVASRRALTAGPLDAMELRPFSARRIPRMPVAVR